MLPIEELLWVMNHMEIESIIKTPFVKTGFSGVLLLVEQELLSLSEQLSSPSVLSRVHVVQSFRSSVLWIIVYSLVTFRLSIVLSVLLLFDYPIGNS
jgi:hypothetical protein